MDKLHGELERSIRYNIQAQKIFRAGALVSAVTVIAGMCALLLSAATPTNTVNTAKEGATHEHT
jgi:hypothetical protein